MMDIKVFLWERFLLPVWINYISIQIIWAGRRRRDAGGEDAGGRTLCAFSALRLIFRPVQRGANSVFFFEGPAEMRLIFKPGFIGNFSDRESRIDQ